MELILKPTSHCNYKCKFCSFSCDTDNNITSVDKIRETINKYNITDVIITGGEPLCLSPDYYSFIYDYPNIEFNFTSNLGLYVKNPSVWKDLFNNSNVIVSTSFQYGNERQHKNLIDNSYVYTEEQFIETMNIFYKNQGYMPHFISVISDENEDTWMKSIELAKKMNTKCKLSPCIGYSHHTHHYNLGKMYQIYSKIIDLNLQEYVSDLTAKNNCPRFNKNCENYIRVLDNHNKLHSCDAFQCDTTLALINTSEKPLIHHFHFDTLKKECYNCSLYKLCNGCFRHLYSIKLDKSYDIELQCKLMKEIEDKLQKNFL